MRKKMRKPMIRRVLLFLLVGMLGMPVFSSVSGQGSVLAAQKIAKGAKKWNGNYYKVYNKYMFPAKAQKYCKKMGGHLVTITSQKEQDFVGRLANRGKQDGYWIGATDYKTAGKWRWMNGDKWDYTNWNSGEPNNGLGSGEDYVLINKIHDWRWTDAFGGYDGYSAKAPFICEWDMPKISASKATLVVGNTKTLKIQYNKSKVKWSSSSKSVAKVSSKGVVTALKKGKATITAKVGKKKYSCKVTVKDASLSAKSLRLQMNGTQQLKVTGTKGKVSWSSANKGVATVSSKGVVKGVKPGTTEIRAKVASSTYKCKVTVLPADVKAAQIAFYTVGGGDFICGESTAQVDFSMEANASNVTAQILDAADQVVYSKYFASCQKGRNYSFQWNGKKGNGAYVGDNSCRVKVIAGNAETVSDYLSIRGESDFAGGNGSEGNPYQVATYEQFCKIDQYAKCHFIQVADIDGEYETLYMMFSSDNPFDGVYDGNGKKISNLVIRNTSSQEGAAVMHSIGKNGVVKNLTLAKCNSNFSLEKELGAFAACLVLENRGKVQGCTIDECAVMASSWGDRRNTYVGMISMKQTLTGVVTGCTVQNCTITGYASGFSRVSYTGGISGINEGKIINCTVKGLSGEGKYYRSNGSSDIGGITASNSGTIINVKVEGYLKSMAYAAGITVNNQGQIQDWSFDGTLDVENDKNAGQCYIKNYGTVTP